MIFLSYAREDGGLTDVPDALFQELATELGESAVFLDKRSIVAGARWEVSIEEALRRARCLVIIFGERWDEVTVPRLTAPFEVLHREFVTTRTAGIPVLPVFVGQMPRRLDLPDSIRSLNDVHWERLPLTPSADDVRSVGGRIIRVAIDEDLRRIVAETSDPIVSGLSLLRAMRPGVRRALAIALRSEVDFSPGQSLARELVNLSRAAIDRAPLEVKSCREGIGALLSCLDLDLGGSDPNRLRAVRQALRPQLDGRPDQPDALDRELLRVLDFVLSRALAIRTGDGSRDPSGILRAREVLGARSTEVQAMHRSARRFLVEDLLVGLDERVRDAVIDLRPIDRIRSRPGPGVRGSSVRERRRKRRR